MAKSLKPRDIREMTLTEITMKLSDLEEELFNLRFRNAMKQLDDALRIRVVKRDIARLKGILRENELGIRKIASESAQK
ncbi:MAG: 50S ribosomal protein L29 [Candidatus Eiseniibacteriota bacterium]|nr:MAG: 50S ribosomal protein L29 [Candidatus Eisenbacteria bacterium]